MGILDNLLNICGERGGVPVLPIREARFVVLDTELTGLGRSDSMVSVGAVRVVQGRILMAESYYNVVNPGIGLKPDSVVVHGITDSEARNGGRPAQAVEELSVFCGDNPIVGHCIDLDMEYISKVISSTELPPMANRLIDTLAIHNWLCSKDQDYSRLSPPPGTASLYAVADCMGIPAFGAHNALMDAYITAQLFQAFIPRLEMAGITSTADLIALSDSSKGGAGIFPKGEITSF